MNTKPTVRDFMATDLHVLSPDTDIYEAAVSLIERRISGAPVVDATGNLVGVLSEKDCLKVLAKGEGHLPAEGSVADFMATEVETIPPAMDIYFAAGMFLAKPYRRFPVVEGDRLVGQISRRDVLKAVQVARTLAQSA